MMRVKSRWVRNAENQKIGYFLAYTDEVSYAGKKVCIGFSFCDTRYDRFNSYIAQDLADDRAFHLKNAKNYHNILAKVPYRYQKDFIHFVHQCVKYFKDKTFPEWVYALEAQYGETNN